MSATAERLKAENDAVRARLADAAYAEREGWRRRTNLDGTPSAWVQGSLEGIAPEAQIGPDVVIYNRAGELLISATNTLSGNTRVEGPVLIDQSALRDAAITGDRRVQPNPGVQRMVGIVTLAESRVEDATVRASHLFRTAVTGDAAIAWTVADEAAVSGPETRAAYAALDPGSFLGGGARLLDGVLAAGVRADRAVEIRHQVVRDNRYAAGPLRLSAISEAASDMNRPRPGKEKSDDGDRGRTI
ncbi:MAG: hypothetical protein PW734_04700 [Verrucomicrobium sp.]|nr:hypothetical protein [Verrucomicrobium sp.]